MLSGVRANHHIGKLKLGIKKYRWSALGPYTLHRTITIYLYYAIQRPMQSKSISLPLLKNYCKPHWFRQSEERSCPSAQEQRPVEKVGESYCEVLHLVQDVCSYRSVMHTFLDAQHTSNNT